MEEQDELYAKGFNAGYLLSKHDPELLQSILKTTSKDSRYFQAITMGKKAHDKEKLLEQLKQSQKSKERGMER
ncbi:MAG: hypothetical protein U0U70_08005 [Chitinophagaceae bacterium]